MAVPSSFVYLDYAASAPMSAAAREAENAYELSAYAGANPNSLHTAGHMAARALDESRRTLARCLGGSFRPADIVFTSGGTESNNLALLGLAEAARSADRRRTSVVLSAIEHDSVLDVAPVLRSRGFEVVFAQPGRTGVVDANTVASLVGPQTALVSLMSANNETGVIQPVGEVARVAHASGALMHTDAVQAFGRIPLELSGVDAVSIAAHKIGGPVGIGALACRTRVRIRPQSFGGGQEQGRRAGTQDVRGALAFAAAAKDCCDNLKARRSATLELSRGLRNQLFAEGTGIVPTVSYESLGEDARLAGIVSILAPGVDSETLVLACDQAGFEVSAASACSSGSLAASHVLLAMGISATEALCSLRISFDERVTPAELDSFADALIDIVSTRRGSLR